MTSNLLEFIKVFLLVFTFSGVIVFVRNFMINLDSTKSDNQDIVPDDIAEKAFASSDTMDYDGMGNYGRFPNLDE